jgi:hypothetical protein
MATIRTVSSLRSLPAIAAIATFGALFAASPSPAFVTIGSDLSSDGGVDICSPQPCTETALQTILPGRATTAPSDGVVTRWAVRNMNGPIQLRVLRPAAGNAFQDVGSSGQASAGGLGVQTFSTRLAIRAGDYIGVDAFAGASLAYRIPAPGASVPAYYPPGRLPDGATAQPTGTLFGFELLLNADIEPDADRDGYGDETQDKCPTDASTHDACPDRTAPTTTLSGSSKQNFLKQKAVIVTALANEAGTVNATGTINLPGASKTLKLKAASASAAANAKTKLKLKIPKKALKAVRKALRHGKRVKATVTVIERDAAGNPSAPAKKTVRAKPPGAVPVP